MSSTTNRPAVERMHPPDVLWKYVVNPVMRTLLRSPASEVVDKHLALLHYQGRRSGEPYAVPVGYHDIAGRPTVLTNSGWRVNFRGGHPFRATLAGEPVSAIGVLEEDPDVVADVYAGLIDELGWNKAGQRLGIKINVDRAPTHAELVTAVEAEGLSLLYLDGQDTDA